MLGINSPREPIGSKFSNEIRAALWRAMTGNLDDREREARRKEQEAEREWVIVKG